MRKIFLKRLAEMQSAGCKSSFKTSSLQLIRLGSWYGGRAVEGLVFENLILAELK